MSPPVADLDASLQAMLSLKPPGVSGTRIQSITALCVANVQSETVLIQKLYTHFKRAPATHKLGVLYVVDSVTRKWTEQAKLAGQTINDAAPDGTFAAGVNRVKELLPAFMNDIISSSPIDQKEKIKKLVEIWEKGQTFPLDMLATFKEKLNAQLQNQSSSTTPPGSPPSDLQSKLGLTPNSAPVSSSAPTTSTILAALANIARQNTAAPAAATNNHPPPPPPQNNLYNVPNTQSIPAPQVAAFNTSVPFPPIPPPAPVNVLAPSATFASQPQAYGNGAQNYASNQTNQFPAMPVIPPPGALDPALQQQMLLVKALLDSGVPADQIPQIVAAMGSGIPLPPPGAIPPPPPQFAAQNQNHHNQNGQNGWSKPVESRDHNGFDQDFQMHNPEPVRSPPGRYRRRSRSRSPQGWNARDSPVRRREEPHHDQYDRQDVRARDDRGRPAAGRGGRQNEYRQRSPPPPPRRRSPSPLRPSSSGSGKKWIDYDPTIGPGKIKVLSRTLFVGGVTTSEAELRRVFEPFGKVQSCIVNKDKRHAFVKMISRADAVSAKEGMERTRTPDSTLRTRWGVGFGPRDCCDYATGISTIPITKLTDADRKWMLSAEYGGSGGVAIKGGMVVEEPDIEIGQGVSSKAISRRMQTDRGGNNGPKSSAAPRDGGRRNSDEARQVDEFGRDITLKEKSPPPTVAPPVPAFGMMPFPFNFPGGMPMFPPGFTMPGQSQGQSQSSSTQPPAPGRS